MAEPTELDRTFHCIMKEMVATGKAPHYTDVARELDVPPAEGRRLVRKLFRTKGFPGWLHPGTDYIASFPPFNSLPTQHRITIGGEQKWFGQ